MYLMIWVTIFERIIFLFHLHISESLYESSVWSIRVIEIFFRWRMNTPVEQHKDNL